MSHGASIARAEKSMHSKGIGTLCATVVLCLPSLVGSAALVFNLLRHPNIAEWEQVSSALIAFGILFGAPLVALAAVVGGLIAFSRRVSVKLKFAHLCVVSAAAIATASLLVRFAR